MNSRGIQKNGVYELFQLLSRYSLSYAYCGNFTDALTRRILTLTEQNMNEVQEDGKTRKRVYFVIVESLQNITRHQACERRNKHDHGFFSMHRSNDSYIITSGNIICDDEIATLKQKLDRVNSMNAGQLTEYYNEVLRGGEISDKGGAGLGLIDMVRKSGNKLSYEFVPLESGWSYFYFQSVVSISGEPGAGGLEVAKSLHGAIKEHDLRTLYCGNFTHDQLNSLIIANDEGAGDHDETAALRRTSAGIIKQLVLNICDHAETESEIIQGKQGLLLIGDTGAERLLMTGNYISDERKAELMEAISFVNGQREEDLNTLYYDSKQKGGAYSGLLEIRVKSGNKIESQLTPVKQGLSFASIQSRIRY